MKTLLTLPPAIIRVFSGEGVGETGFLQKAGSPAFLPSSSFLFPRVPGGLLGSLLAVRDGDLFEHQGHPCGNPVD